MGRITMKAAKMAMVFAAGILAGCMAGGIPAPAEQGGAAGPSSGNVHLGTPLIVDRTDLRLGTTVQYRRIPTITELADLTQLPALAHVVIALPEWPNDYGPLQALDRIPTGADLVVVLPGYPPSRGAADLWSYVNGVVPVRIILVVPGPPPSTDVINDLNSMRNLERVIVEMDYPARTGFERLQRPMSFRKVVD
jgi:hypothetical protein